MKLFCARLGICHSVCLSVCLFALSLAHFLIDFTKSDTEVKYPKSDKELVEVNMGPLLPLL